MFDLPQPPRYRLDRPPLVLALAQVHFDLQARLATLEGIAPIQDRLEDLLPYMEDVREQELSLVFGPGGIAAPPQLDPPAQTWRFTDDAGWTLVIAAQGATLSVGSNYQSVEEISSRFERVVDVLASAGRIRRCTRLGVRYINIAEFAPGDDSDWRTWFRPEFLGWVADRLVAGETVASVAQTQTQASLPAEAAEVGLMIQGIVRHGIVPKSTMVPGLPQPTSARGYLIDLDLFVPGPQPMTHSQLVRQFSYLHDQIDRFFHWTLAEAGCQHFGLREVSE